MSRLAFPPRRQLFNAILAGNANSDVLFPGSWLARYGSDNATVTTWPAINGPDLARQGVDQVIGVTTDALTGLGAREDAAIETAENGGATLGGYTSQDGGDSVRVALPSAGFTVRAIVRPVNDTTQRPIWSWMNFLGSGDDFFVQLQHTSSSPVQLQVSGVGGTTTEVVPLTINAWQLMDIYVQPGTQIICRINGTETVMASAVRDPTTNGPGHIGIGARGWDGTAPSPGQRFVGFGIASGDVGLTAHNALVSLLGL